MKLQIYGQSKPYLNAFQDARLDCSEGRGVFRQVPDIGREVLDLEGLGLINCALELVCHISDLRLAMSRSSPAPGYRALLY